MNEPHEVPLLNVDLVIQLPAEVVLPCGLDEQGQLVASNGVVFQRFLDHEALERMGVSVTWRDPDGNAVPPETALASIERQREAHALAQHHGLAANDPS